MTKEKEMKAVVFAQWLQLSSAYPGGVPDLACSTMFPSGHNSAAQTSSPPYKMFTPKTIYKPGETISIVLFGEKALFTGLYVQARHVGCHVNTTYAIGAFTASDSRLQTRHCFGTVHSAVTHTSNVRKDSVSFYWTAPVIPSGHLVFRATIVKDSSTFWVDVESKPLVDLQSKDTLKCDGVTRQSLPQPTRGYFTTAQSANDSELLTINRTHDLYELGASRSKQDKSSAVISTMSRNIITYIFIFILSI